MWEITLTFFLIGLTGYGIYLSKKRKMVLFANSNDIIVTLMLPFVPFVCWFFLAICGIGAIFGPIVVMWGTILVTVAILIWFTIITIKYNLSKGFGLHLGIYSIYTKLSSVFILACIFVLLLLGNSRESGETKAAYRKRYRKALGESQSSGIDIMSLGIWEVKWIPFKKYLYAQWD